MDLETFKERLRGRPLPAVVDVWAPWCGPCKAIEPSLKKLSLEYEGRVDLIKINADEEPQLVRALGIYGIPTTLAFHGDREVMRTTGAQPQTSLAGLFEAALGGEKPVQAGLGSRERLLRVAAGITILLVTSFMNNPSFLGYILGGIVLFSAFYDRCPIWQEFASRRAGRGSPSSKADL